MTTSRSNDGKTDLGQTGRGSGAEEVDRRITDLAVMSRKCVDKVVL